MKATGCGILFHVDSSLPGILIFLFLVRISASKKRFFMNWCRFLDHEYRFLNAIASCLILKKDFMAPIYRWGLTASRLQSHYYDTGCLLPLSPQEFLVLIWSTFEGWRSSRPWSHRMVLNPRPLDLEFSTLTTRPLKALKKQKSS